METEGDKRVELVGPFHERRLVIDGWSVPLLEAVELDGGKFHFRLDHRLGLDVDAKDFERVARFLADTVAVALGLPCHPEGKMSEKEMREMWMLVPHPALAPVRTSEISAVSTA